LERKDHQFKPCIKWWSSNRLCSRGSNPSSWNQNPPCRHLVVSSAHIILPLSATPPAIVQGLLVQTLFT